MGYKSSDCFFLLIAKLVDRKTQKEDSGYYWWCILGVDEEGGRGLLSPQYLFYNYFSCFSLWSVRAANG